MSAAGIKQKLPVWDRWLSDKLEPFWPGMVVLALVVIAITLYLLIKQDKALMAIWLAFVVSP